MSSGKKGKKKKCKTVDLMSFLADGSGAPPAVPVKPINWADDVEEEHEGYTSRSSKEPVILPTAPRAARGPRVADEDIPTSPPYVAYISNLPFEVNEDDLAVFFSGMKIANMRLPKDSSRLLRGYGYVEFEDRQSLIDALCISNTPMKTRRIRIEVSNSSNDDRRGGRMGRDNRRDAYDDPERTSGDWRSGPREDASLTDGDSYRNRFDNRDRRDDRDRDPDYDNKPGAWRESGDRGRSAFRDKPGFRDDEKEWSRFGDKDSRDREGDRGSSFGPRRNFERDSDRDWERKPRPATDPKPETRSRPKLQLQPRTKPVEAAAAAAAPAADTAATAATAATVKEEPAKPAAPAPALQPAVNIFGAAKPVDTTAREREIEERLAKSYTESRFKEENDAEKRGSKEGTWGKRNGEGREDKDKSRQTWRSEDQPARRTEKPLTQSQIAQPDSKGPPPPRSGPPATKTPPKSTESRATSDRDRKERDKDNTNKMPKAKDEQAPNFVASNKYSMLPDDVDPDNIDD